MSRPRHKNPRFRSSYEDKIEWIRKHPKLWKLPERELGAKMIEAGLFSPNTVVQDMNLRRLIRQAEMAEV